MGHLLREASKMSTRKSRKSVDDRIAEILALGSSGVAEEARMQREAAIAEVPRVLAAVNAAGVRWDKSLELLLVDAKELSDEQYKVVAKVFLEYLKNGPPHFLASMLFQLFAAPPRSRARPYWSNIAHFFISASNEHIRDYAAIALAAIAERADSGTVLSWLGDSRFGKSRIFLLSTLSRLVSSADRVALLGKLKEDPDLRVQCERELRGLGPKDD